MKFNVITIFPDLISHYCTETILGRAQEKDIISVNAVNLRDFTTDKHQKVDDTPYGGGAGMVMKPEPIYRALEALGALRANTATLQHYNTTTLQQKSAEVLQCSHADSKKTILLSPRGRQFDQRVAEEWSTLKEITFVCGRYEGVDQRVSDFMVDEEISIGPYVLAGGELGALVMIEAISRLLPGVLGNPESLAEETFGVSIVETPSYLPLQGGGQSKKDQKNFAKQNFSGLPLNPSPRRGGSGRGLKGTHQIEYPQYTKPADFMGHTVPDILLSGDHKRIAKWRKGVPVHSPSTGDSP